MTDKTSNAVRSLSGIAFAAACGSMLLLGTLSPATASAQGMKKSVTALDQTASAIPARR